jgi:mannose-6-phosphate isomerase-like protein (cupin superfamily)
MPDTPAVLTRAQGDRAGQPLRVGPDTCRRLVAAVDTAQQLAVFEWQGNAPGGPPLHLHPAQDEVFMVDEGEYLFQCGDAQHRLGPGDTLFLPRQVPHTFCQLSARGRLRYLYTPAGRMEAFFEALAELDAPPALAEAEALFAAHGMRVVGPPLAPA